jgi:hypothetical protein
MKFSKWEKFDDRESLRDIGYPGIYALAISRSNIAGTAFSYREDIAYFGMTNSRAGLRGRLKQFNNTMRRLSGPGHGGAKRFRHDYKDGNFLAEILYVAVCPFKCDVTSIAREDLETMGEVARAEFVAWANYVERFKRLPKYNDKKNSPKELDDEELIPVDVPQHSLGASIENE